MIKLSELVAKIEENKVAEQTAKADVKDYVGVVETNVISAFFTEPNDNGDIFVRLSTASNELPFFNQNGEIRQANSVLLFCNQLIAAMANHPELALYANLAYLKSKGDDLLPMVAKVLHNRKIRISYIALSAGDNYIDPATGIKFDTTCDHNLIKYAIEFI